MIETSTTHDDDQPEEIGFVRFLAPGPDGIPSGIEVALWTGDDDPPHWTTTVDCAGKSSDEAMREVSRVCKTINLNGLYILPIERQMGSDGKFSVYPIIARPCVTEEEQRLVYESILEVTKEMLGLDEGEGEGE